MKFTKATSIHNQRMLTNPLSHKSKSYIQFQTYSRKMASGSPRARRLISVTPQVSHADLQDGSLTRRNNTVLQDSAIATDTSDYTVYINNPTTPINTKVCSRQCVLIKMIISRNTFTVWWKYIWPVSACILLHQKGCELFQLQYFGCPKTQF